MALPKVTDPVNNITSQPVRPVISASALQALFDETGKDLKVYLNDSLTVALESITDGSSGADNIGATPISGGTANTVQGIVEELNAKAVSGVGALNTHKASADHDGRYYTEAEVNALLLANQQGNHLGTWQGYSPTFADPGIASVVAEHTIQISENLNFSKKEIKDYIYNFDVGLSNWFENLSNFRSISSKTINVSVVGDSISEGNAAGNGVPSNFFENGYLGQLKNRFNSNFGDAGDGFIPVYLTTNAPKWSFNGFVEETGFFGASGVSRMSQTSGDTATLNFNGTGIGIVFPKRSNGGVLSISIDGGLPINIDTYDSSEIYADVYEINGLSNSSHNLVITSQLTIGEKVWIHGAFEIKNTTGIRFNMVGRSGVASASVSTIPALPAEIDVWKPSLTIIPLIANDFGAQTPLSTYETNLQSIITRAKLYGDVLLVSIGMNTNVLSIPQIQYVNTMKKLSDLNKVAFLDMYKLWGSDPLFAKNRLGYIFDHVHPTDLGHSDIANHLYDALTYQLNQSEILSRKKTTALIGTLSSGVIGRGFSSKISTVFGHREEINAKDLIIFKYDSPLTSGDSSSIIGKIRIVFAGRNTGGVRAHAAKEYDFYFDNESNMTLTERLSYAPVTLGATVNILLSRKGTDPIIELTITPSSFTLTGSVYVETDFLESFSTNPIQVNYSNLLI